MPIFLVLSLALNFHCINGLLNLIFYFLGNMGGEIGLMLGASLLTFVEFIDLFGFLAYHQLLRLSNNKSRNRKTAEEVEITSSV